MRKLKISQQKSRNFLNVSRISIRIVEMITSILTVLTISINSIPQVTSSGVAEFLQVSDQVVLNNAPANGSTI